MPGTAETARLAGVNAETLRYYERRGLIPRPPRRKSYTGHHPGYRIYSMETVERIRFIKRAQKLGFTLEEIKRLLDAARGKKVKCAGILKFIRNKLSEIEKKISELGEMRKILKSLMKKCAPGGESAECPIMKGLGKKGRK